MRFPCCTFSLWLCAAALAAGCSFDSSATVPPVSEQEPGAPDEPPGPGSDGDDGGDSPGDDDTGRDPSGDGDGDGDNEPVPGPDAGTPPGLPDAAPHPPDDDGDGVPDDSDNCPFVPNEAQGDEDRDGRGDACDNCPSVPNPGQENAEETARGDRADEVGDACDPRPEEGGDRIALFDGFNGPLDPSWLDPSVGTSGASWQTVGGRLQQANENSLDARLLRLDIDPPTVFIDTSVTVNAFTSIPRDSSPRSAGTLSAYALRPGTDGAYACALRADAGSRRGSLRLGRLGGFGSGFIDDASLPGPLAPAVRYRLLQYTNEREREQFCVVINDGPDSAASGDNPEFGAGGIGFRTSRAAASWDFIVVYELGGPL